MDTTAPGREGTRTVRLLALTSSRPSPTMTPMSAARIIATSLASLPTATHVETGRWRRPGVCPMTAVLPEVSAHPEAASSSSPVGSLMQTLLSTPAAQTSTTPSSCG
jgi:hypothetical protein